MQSLSKPVAVLFAVLTASVLQGGTTALQTLLPPVGNCFPADTRLFSCVGEASISDEILAFGWSFYVDGSSPIAITEMGLFDATPEDGLRSDFTVGVWDRIGTLLGSGTVRADGAYSDGFRFSAVTPFTLPAGHTFYQLGVIFPAGATPEDFIVQFLATPVVTAPVSFAGHSLGFLDPGTLAQEIVPLIARFGGSGGYFGPNFRFEEVPEPSTLSLAGVAMIVCALATRGNM